MGQEFELYAAYYKNKNEVIKWNISEIKNIIAEYAESAK